MRICSPPIRHQCFFGVDMARRDELIASHKDVDGIRRHIGADSLGYLSLAGMVRATGGTKDEYCAACFTGDYLVPVQLELDKSVLETETSDERLRREERDLMSGAARRGDAAQAAETSAKR